MTPEEMQKLRDLTDGEEFVAARRRLRDQVIPTPELSAVIAEVSKVHRQAATARDPSAKWSVSNRLVEEGFLAVGQSGSGKTYAMEQAIKLLEPLKCPDGSTLELNLMAAHPPAQGNAASLFKELIDEANGGVLGRVPKPEDADRRIRNALARRQFSLIYIDELSNCLDPHEHQGKRLVVESGRVFKLLRNIMENSTCSTPIVASGNTDVLYTFNLPDNDDETRRIRRDMQRRLNLYRFRDMTIESDAPFLEGIIAGYCKLLGVKSILTADDEIGPRLVHASHYAFGTALRFAQKAVALAHVRPRGKLKREDFAATYNFRATCGASANVFLASEWGQIDTAVLNPRDGREARYRDADGVVA